MIGFIVDQILGPFWPYITGAVIAVGGWFLAKRQGAQGAKATRAVKDAKAEAQAHERMNNADLGIGATDAERIERLRGFAAKHGNGQAKGEGG